MHATDSILDPDPLLLEQTNMQGGAVVLGSHPDLTSMRTAFERGKCADILPESMRRLRVPRAAKHEWLPRVVLALRLTTPRLRLLSAPCGPLGARTYRVLRVARLSSLSELLRPVVVQNHSLFLRNG